MHLRNLLVLLLFLLSFGCGKKYISQCQELLEVAQNQIVINNIWNKLSAFYGYKYEGLHYTNDDYVLLDRARNELGIYSSSALSNKIGIDWSDLGFMTDIDPLKDIIFKYKNNFEKEIVNGEKITQNMIASIAVGSRGNQVEFNLVNDNNGISYALSVSCNNREETKTVNF